MTVYQSFSAAYTGYSFVVHCIISVLDLVEFCFIGKSRRRGAVVSGVRRMNEVNTRQARLVHGWVIVFWRVYHLGM